MENGGTFYGKWWYVHLLENGGTFYGKWWYI
jgi:hypothetical protein